VVAPSSFDGAGPSAGPSVAIATYDPATGRFATPDGGVYRQEGLAPGGGERSWEDLLATG
ncbi:MAG: virulence factor Mce, partial [Mycobacteriaceae bacterium]|nr:virulence factor Mce [Mycobacteriaceae bacterium]